MTPDFSYSLLQYLTPLNLALTFLGFLFAFIVWEAPRSFRLLEEGWMKGVYPEHGKVVDVVLLVVGFVSFIFMQLNLQNIIQLVYRPVYELLLPGGMMAIPIVFLLGFAGRIFARMDAKHEPSSFMMQTALDFVHTLFFICFVALVLPSATLLLSYFM